MGKGNREVFCKWLFINIEGLKRTACIIGRGGNETYPARNDKSAYGGGEKLS